MSRIDELTRELAEADSRASAYLALMEAEQDPNWKDRFRILAEEHSEQAYRLEFQLRELAPE